jgi:hypothetical protein
VYQCQHFSNHCPRSRGVSSERGWLKPCRLHVDTWRQKAGACAKLLIESQCHTHRYSFGWRVRRTVVSITTTKWSTVFSLLETYLSESVCGVPLFIQQDTNNDANEVRSSSVVRCHVNGLEVPTLSNIRDESVNQPQVSLVFSSWS